MRRLTPLSWFVLITATVGLCACLVSCASIPRLPDGTTDWATVLTWAKQGITPVCAPGQQTLSAETCTDTLDGIDLAIAAIRKNPAQAKAAVHQFLTDIEARHPEIADWLSWIRA